jgi:type IV pilus biogenesis/stability protein PilW
VYRKSIIIFFIILFAFGYIGCAGTQKKEVSDKKKAEALQNLGASYVREGKLREGLRNLHQAVKLDPDNGELHNQIALVYMNLAEYDASLRHFKKALALKPRYPEVQNNLGNLYLLLRKWDLAIARYQKAVADVLYRTPHFAYTNMGLAYYNKGEYEKAIEVYQHSLELEPTYSTTYFNLAYAYEATQKWEQAIGAYQKAIQHLPNDPAAYYRLGKLYLKLDRKEEASKAFEEFLEIAPKGPYEEEVKEILRTIQKK